MKPHAAFRHHLGQFFGILHQLRQILRQLAQRADAFGRRAPAALPVPDCRSPSAPPPAAPLPRCRNRDRGCAPRLPPPPWSSAAAPVAAGPACRSGAWSRTIAPAAGRWRHRGRFCRRSARRWRAGPGRRSRPDAAAAQRRSRNAAAPRVRSRARRKPASVPAMKRRMPCIQPAHDAEIHRHQPALAVHEQIAGMHVGMEKAVAQRLGEEAAHQSQRDFLGIMARGAQRVGVADGRAVDPFAGQHARRGAGPVHMRHAEFRVAAGALVKFGSRRRFHAQIQLQRHRRRQRLAPARSSAAAAPRPKSVRPCAANSASASRSRANIVLDAGPQHLHRRRPAPSLVVARCTWAMEAAATGAPKLENRLSTGLPKLVGDHRARRGVRERRQPVLQMLQRARRHPRRQCRAASPASGPA